MYIFVNIFILGRFMILIDIKSNQLPNQSQQKNKDDTTIPIYHIKNRSL